MKKFLALGLLGISHACDPTVRTDCIQDSSGLYRPATSTEIITNLVLTKITSGIHKDKYNISDCNGSPKTWGDDREGNVVECGITTLADLAPGLHLNEAYENGHVGHVVTYRRILVETNAKCSTLTTSSNPTLGAVCGDVAGYTGALIAGATCASTVCDATDVTTCCVSKFTVGTSSLARTKLVASLNGKSKGARLDWSTDNNDATSFTAAERREAVKLITDGEKIKYEAGTKKRTAIGRTRKGSLDEAKQKAIKQTKGETIEFPVDTADGNDHVCVDLGDVGVVCFTITQADLGDPFLGSFEYRRRLSGATSCFKGFTLISEEGDNIYSFNGAFNASNKCAITETVDSEGASQYKITKECNSGVTTDIQDSGTFSPWTTTPATTTSTTCEYCHSDQVSGCTHCAEGLGVKSGECEVCSSGSHFNSEFDHTACDACPAHSTSSADGEYKSCVCKEGWTGGGYITSPTGSGPYNGCTNVDECVLGTDDCDGNAKCTDSVGSFSCACIKGYSGDGVTCTNVDECVLGTDDCDGNAKCTDSVGSFSCACIKGYSGDGVTCTNVDECVLGTDDCDGNAGCTDSVGSFSCACNTGYSGDGVTCTVCAKGKYSDAGSATCTSCEHSTTTSGTGATSVAECSLCPAGLGTKGSNPVKCEVCSTISKFNSELDESPCDACPTNSTSSTDGLTCTCVPGWTGNGYTDSPSTDPNPGCTKCTLGKYSLIPNAPLCLTCDTIANAATVQCTTGFDQKITTCDAGYYGSPGDASCEKCDPGSVTNTGTSAGATSCVTCDPGSITNTGTSAGATMCTLCAPGLYSSSSDVASCSTCGAGSITNTGTSAGAIKCNKCAAGTYSLTSNVASCSTCAGIDNATTVQCTTASDQTIVTCDAGYYGSPGDASCQICVAGEYNGVVGAAACKSCTVEVNGYSTVPGLTKSDDCKSCSGFSTEWINSQCCGKSSSDNDWSDHCGILDGQCGVSC